RHIEIDLAGSDLSYQPGDALGVWFDNDGAMVDELLALTGLDGGSSVSVDGNSLSLRDALIRDYELTQLTPGFVKGYAEAGNIAALLELQADPAALRGYIGERQVIDVVREHPAKVSSEQLLAALRRLAPRLYSIASSQAEVGEEVHLTLAVVRYDAFGHEHLGGASGFLAERLAEGGEVRVFVEHNDNFRLPADDSTPIIMVGPGTGIAPFRAFMQERDARGASGDNWLFFGNPSFTEDFLYQVEWQGWKKSGLLTRIDLAWSRDQKDKIYVQQRLREQGAEVWGWLERGAHVYVCGDASRMAKDVQDALLEIIVSHGGKSQEDAEEYLNELRRAKRYQRDVY
ncbi:MAG: sulfite reductase [NADPH] flavoprotein alpha-component, partial [Corallincola sp.]|nr:sulfite reductase [NADPH] flavoprotein alpha-component [Corallincola sp.]